MAARKLDVILVLNKRIAHHIMFDNIFLFQIHQMLRKVEPRMQFASFVIEPSVDAALQK